MNTEIDSKNLKIFNRKTKPSVKRAENLKNLSGNLKNIGKYNSVLHVLKKKFNECCKCLTANKTSHNFSVIKLF